MVIRYIGTGDALSAKNVGRVETLQEITFGNIYVTGNFLRQSHWWVVFDGGSPVGFASLTLYDDERNTAFLSLAGVIPSARGKGLQRKLIKRRVDKSIELGAGRVITYVAPDNVISGNNLIKCGFKLYVPDFEYGVDGAIYFQKKLV